LCRVTVSLPTGSYIALEVGGESFTLEGNGGPAVE
jgi:hypothetical protein